MEQFTKAQRVAPGNALVLVDYGGATNRVWAGGMPRWSTSARPSASIRAASISSLVLGDVLSRLRRYAEAREPFDRVPRPRPRQPGLASRGKVHLPRGGRSGRSPGRSSRRRRRRSSRRRWSPSWRNYGDLIWVLDESQRELLLRLTPSAFRNDRSGHVGHLPGAGLRLARETRRASAPTPRRREGIFEEQPAHGARRSVSVRVSSASRWHTWGEKEEAIREGNAGDGARARRQGRFARSLRPAPTRAHLHAPRRIRKRRSTSSSRS